MKYINIIDNPDTYFSLWKKYCDEFFDFLKTNCPETRVILAEVCALDVVQRPNLSTYVDSNFTKKAKINNYYYKKLESYIQCRQVKKLYFLLKIPLYQFSY